MSWRVEVFLQKCFPLSLSSPTDWRQSAQAVTVPQWDNYTCSLHAFFQNSLTACLPALYFWEANRAELTTPQELKKKFEEFSGAPWSGAAVQVLFSIHFIGTNWYFHYPANTNLSSISSFQHESFVSQSLCLSVQVSLGMTRFMMFKGFQTLSERLVFWTMLCIVYKLKDGLAWGREGAGWARVNYVATGTKYCFICTCMQSKKTRNGKKYYPRDWFGWNLLEIVDDNAASCVYTVKK